jgi:hypothetical protein
MKRDNMIIYRSFYEAIKELKPIDQVKIWEALYELGLNGIEIELMGIQKTIFTLIKPQIEANIKRYENGKKPKDSKSEAKDKQEISKIESNKNNNKNNNNNNKSLEDRKKDFSNYLYSFKNTDYSDQLLSDFMEYWTEHGSNDKKMRFEKEKSFGVTRRLSTWNKRSEDKYSDPGTDKLLNHVKNQINEQGK